jgi:hypothetical protein
MAAGVLEQLYGIVQHAFLPLHSCRSDDILRPYIEESSTIVSLI